MLTVIVFKKNTNGDTVTCVQRKSVPFVYNSRNKRAHITGVYIWEYSNSPNFWYCESMYWYVSLEKYSLYNRVKDFLF